MKNLQDEAFTNNFLDPKSGSQTAPLGEILSDQGSEVIQAADAINRKNLPGFFDKLNADSPAQIARRKDIMGERALSKGPGEIRESQQLYGPEHDRMMSRKMKERAGLLGGLSGLGGFTSLLSPRQE